MIEHFTHEFFVKVRPGERESERTTPGRPKKNKKPPPTADTIANPTADPIADPITKPPLRPIDTSAVTFTLLPRPVATR